VHYFAWQRWECRRFPKPVPLENPHQHWCGEFELPRAVKCRASRERKMDASFEYWYSYYPRKQGRAAAEKAWLSMRIDPAIVDKMVATLQEQCQSPQWKRGYIPQPVNYLRQRRWEDETIDHRSEADQTPLDGVQDWLDERTRIRPRNRPALGSGRQEAD
jgi:hypothetical protein